MLPEHLWCKTLIEPCNKCLLFLLHLCHLAKWVCGNMKFRDVDIAPSVDSPSGSHSVLPAGFFPIAPPRQCHCTTQWDQQQDRIAELQRADLERALLPENVLEIVIRNKQPPSCANHSQICPLGTGHTNRMLGAMKYQFVNPWHIFTNKTNLKVHYCALVTVVSKLKPCHLSNGLRRMFAACLEGSGHSDEYSLHW